MDYNPQEIEKKWRTYWEKNKVFQVDLSKAKKPYYNLMMFPYPSAEGLHVGNVYAFTGSDIHGRFRRMQGYDVFEPIGFDAFGIHSENFAIKKGIHPKVLIKKNTDNFREQLKSLGCLFDWRYEVDTTKPDYYRWTQWLFLQLYKADLAYRKKAPVDWCPSCKTVLADEQVISGRCERCDSEVIQKQTEQWFFKITKYAEKLLKNLDWIDWSERTKLSQKNWIGKSEGADIDFGIDGFNEEIKVFTTRPDTLFGATFMVLSPEHPLAEKITKEENKVNVEKYREEARKKSDLERTELAKEKTGVFTGSYAINPVNNSKIPIWIADYVLVSYGYGAIMAVPAHDQRDFDFAKKYDLPIIEVISVDGQTRALSEAYIGEGILINSGKFNEIESKKAKWEITKFVKGKKTINYHLRDWLISRQRYWGPPIPIIYCQKCGIVPVPEKDLPVLLPYVKNFRPTGTGESPLASVENFVKTKCPKCNGPAKRETDVSDTFLDSSWYYLRYPSVGEKNSVLEIENCKLEIPWNQQITRRWLPVDMYIGGQEHAVLHLMYTRFITMVLKDLGLINFEEPFRKFRAHGLLTKGGAKMSKSKGNVVNPDDYYKKYGADTLRMYLMFIGPFEQGGDWQDRGVIGIARFLEKVWRLQKKVENGIQSKKLDISVNKTIKKVTEDLENLQYNTAISALMILTNEMAGEEKLPASRYQTLITMLAPFAPYISEELWHQLAERSEGSRRDLSLRLGNKNSAHNQQWPKYDPKLIKEEKITLIVQINGKVRDKIEVACGISEKEARELTLNREKVKKHILGKEVKKVIFVKGKLINIVV
ncbi:MAG: leucine--tRNA ligase [Candidatus Nealsonbacteria bacterium CG09_land_8_20_14_0_10_42_14]|uniref:Leucine--tRNA ligase n=1 Tax=Candidatus Nealsonbacteria bacterium CG09_land_8_20_14_0_10_42_14 TaxID=1974707 RepID=A0A2H0WX83_9BACT|nr:MAG: leucine--tRNA ligase [Candidatus Nealsonbacteria bacterium CG09_land_8_20_14_0_10_42_14]